MRDEDGGGVRLRRGIRIWIKGGENKDGGGGCGWGIRMRGG